MAFFGQDPVFYDLLEAQAEAAHKTAEAFHALSSDFGQAEQIASNVRRLETDADSLTHDLVNKADAKFITPLDKNDLTKMTCTGCRRRSTTSPIRWKRRRRGSGCTRSPRPGPTSRR